MFSSSGVIDIVIIIWLKVLSVERTLERINQSYLYTLFEWADIQDCSVKF